MASLKKFGVVVMSGISRSGAPRISQRTRDALERKALRGQNAGGRVYGYRNVGVKEDGERRVAPPGAREARGRRLY